MKWKYFPCYWPFVRGIHRTPVDSPHKDQWRGALVFSLICAWTNGSANNRDAGDLSHPHVHYNVTVIHFVKMVQTHQLKAIDIKNNAWVTVNNDFLSRVGWFGNDFHEWRSHEWKSLSNRLTSDKKALFTVMNVLFHFLHAISCHQHTNPLKTYYRLLISPLLPRAVFSDLVLWRHHNWSVTSREGDILVLLRHIRRLLWHAQIGAKAIFTSE